MSVSKNLHWGIRARLDNQPEWPSPRGARKGRRGQFKAAYLAFFSAYFLSPLLAFAGQTARSTSPAQPENKLPTLTTAFAAHSLRTAEASRLYPVRLRGVVTCIAPSTSPGEAAIFLHDATGSIYVTVAEKYFESFPAGTLVEVKGVSGPGLAAPIVDSTEVRAIGHAPLPAVAPLQDIFHLETGAEDGKWVTVEGTIHAIFEHQAEEDTHHFVAMQLAMPGGMIGVAMLWEPGVDYTRLIDARVRIRGNAAPITDRGSGRGRSGGSAPRRPISTARDGNRPTAALGLARVSPTSRPLARQRDAAMAGETALHRGCEPGNLFANRPEYPTGRRRSDRYRGVCTSGQRKSRAH